MDNTRPVGTNPITSFQVTYLGRQIACNSASHRDLGFTGHIAGKWYAVWGDVLWCRAGVTDPEDDPPGFHGMVRDAVSAMTDDPLVVVDLNLNEFGRQLQFIPFNKAWGEAFDTGFGGTSLVEVDGESATGAVFYLVNLNQRGLKGAGVAKVQVIDGTPTVEHRFGENGYWWPVSCNPCYGDIAAFRDPHSEYIYAWGHPPTTITDWHGQAYVYQCRVKAKDAFELSKYEYWWGRAKGWSSRPLDAFTPETAVLWGTGQGQVVWNAFFGCYIFVHLGIGGDGSVFLRTAPKPEGPWSADVKIYEDKPIDGGFVYAGVAHPYLDKSGRTLTISFTNNNRTQVIKVAFRSEKTGDGGVSALQRLKSLIFPCT